MVEVNIVEVLATLVPVLSSLAALAYWLEVKFAYIDARFKEIDRRFEEVNRRFEGIDKKFEELRGYIDNRISRIVEASRAYQEFFVEYLTVRGLLTPSESSMLKKSLLE